MLVSKKWLGEYFEDKLPEAKEMAEALTMRAFEVESVEPKGDDHVLDVKVLPNRTHDALSHRGIARELAALLGLGFKDREFKIEKKDEIDPLLSIKVDDPRLCLRYIGKRIENIEVKQSPQWLREKLEVLGERSINNIVDITNYITLDLGQPMHAFDADKVRGDIHVRSAKEGERITLLGGEEVELDQSFLLIADDLGPLVIAGIKGGKRAEVTEETKNIILESANFKASMVRKSSQKLGIKNNSSKRYENEISPDLAGLAMDYAEKLVLELASTGETLNHERADAYPRPKNLFVTGFSTKEINSILGAELSDKDIEIILDRTGWKWDKVKPREKICELAGSLVGKPYKYGASVSYDAPDRFDCSSFTSYLYSQAAIAIPRTTVDQFVFGKELDASEIEPGDVVFSQNGDEKEEKEIVLAATGETVTQKVLHTKTFEFMPGTPVPEGIDHDGVYLGDGKIAYASGVWHKGQVVVENLGESPSFKNIKGYRRMADLDEERYAVTVPFERLDLRTKEDMAEEIGRIYGYEKVEPQALPTKLDVREVLKGLYYSQKISKILVSLGFSEIRTYAFSEKGEVEVENPTAKDKSFLRDSLRPGLEKALELNAKNAALLGLDEVKIFEIGTVFKKDFETLEMSMGIQNIKKDKKKEGQKLSEAADTLSKSLGLPPGYSWFNGFSSEKVMVSGLDAIIKELPEPVMYDFQTAEEREVKFKSISPYPFVLRDIAVWTPAETSEEEALRDILDNAGELLVRHKLFDRFEKEGRVSYAFNLVFQSPERTLTDAEINGIMDKITSALNSREGWQVR